MTWTASRSRAGSGAGCDVRVLGTTGEGGPVAVLRALRFGSAGCSTDGSRHEPPDRAGRARASGGAFTAEQQEIALHELAALLRHSRERSRVRSSLSAREQEVLAMIAEGLSTKQMASRLGISPRTVESHISRAYRKLSVRTRVQAVARAAQAGIADLRPRSRAKQTSSPQPARLVQRRQAEIRSNGPIERYRALIT